jgi:uncharacterized protein involved in response to NO
MLNQLIRRLCPVCAAGHPVWLCGFRPFFVLTAVAAPLLICLWLAFLALGLPLPTVVGGPFIWHAHELIFGFGLAAVAGFALTSIPEFTASGAVDRLTIRWLTGLWLLGRLAFWTSGLLGDIALAVSGLAHLVLLGLLAACLAPRLWRDPNRRHLSFLWSFGGLALGVVGFYGAALRGQPPGPWLHATLGVLMMLIVVAMSRISMRIVNNAIDEGTGDGETATVDYRARPPRRNLAILCIGLYTLAELLLPGSRISGWLALAAAAALLNLLNDWHVGRALLRRWPLMLYGVYGLIAAGYATMGLALILDSAGFSAGRHLLTVGALGLNIYVVMCIAGRTHSGYALDERRWVPIGALMLVLAAIIRAASAWSENASQALLAISGLLWAGAFLLYAWHMLPILLAPRPDHGLGCEGVMKN